MKILTLHDLVWKACPDTMSLMNRVIDRLLIPRSISLANHIVTDSNTIADTVRSNFNISINKITTIYCGVNFKEYNNNSYSLPFLINKNFFLFVGTIGPRKNVYRLLQAYSQLSKEIKREVSAVIVGEQGRLHINLEHISKKFNITDNIIILDHIADELLINLYKKALFLAMPSIYEGFGLPIIEAMKFELPVLTSNVSSMPEVAGNAAILVDPLDINSIKEGLERLIIDKELRSKLSSNAKRRSSKFDWDKSSKQLLNVFYESKYVADNNCVQTR